MTTSWTRGSSVYFTIKVSSQKELPGGCRCWKLLLSSYWGPCLISSWLLVTFGVHMSQKAWIKCSDCSTVLFSIHEEKQIGLSLSCRLFTCLLLTIIVLCLPTISIIHSFIYQKLMAIRQPLTKTNFLLAVEDVYVRCLWNCSQQPQ